MVAATKRRAPAKPAARRRAPAKNPPAKRAPAKRAPAKRAAAKRAPAKRAPAKRVYRRRAANPPLQTNEILGGVLGGALGAVAGSLIAAAASTNETVRRAIRIGVPSLLALVAANNKGPMSDGLAKGALGAAGVELAAMVAGTMTRATNPPVIYRAANPPIPIYRQANPPQLALKSYPASRSGVLPRAFQTPLTFTGNPYT